MSIDPDNINVEAFQEWSNLMERYPGLHRALFASFSDGVDFRAACEEKAREIRETPEYRVFYGEEM
jgi:pterin-4a-carbinolamine dehydratase